MNAQRHIFSLFGVGCFALALGAVPPADKPGPDEKMKEILANLPNASEQDGERIASGLSNDRAQVQSQLILQLLSPKSKQHQIVVVYLLGLYRMEGAARHLAKFITLEAEEKLHQRLPLWSRYPAVDALVKIGMPSIPVVMERIETSDDKLVIELGAKVIKGVLGQEIAEGVVKQAIIKLPDADKKKKLEEALGFLKPEPP